METNTLKLPTIAEIFGGVYSNENSAKEVLEIEKLNFYLNHEPKKEWILTHPLIKGFRYIPIDKVEFMLRKIFKTFSIEILREGTAFNGVYVVVRVHYLHPVYHEMRYHDGIGAAEMQTVKGSKPSDMQNINHGALVMAFPIAKTLAIKDACDHFGLLFGCGLNRKDVHVFSFDEKLLDDTEYLSLLNLFAAKKELLNEEEYAGVERIIKNKEKTGYEKAFKLLNYK